MLFWDTTDDEYNHSLTDKTADIIIKALQDMDKDMYHVYKANLKEDRKNGIIETYTIEIFKKEIK